MDAVPRVAPTPLTAGIAVLRALPDSSCHFCPASLQTLIAEPVQSVSQECALRPAHLWNGFGTKSMGGAKGARGEQLEVRLQRRALPPSLPHLPGKEAETQQVTDL